MESLNVTWYVRYIECTNKIIKEILDKTGKKVTGEVCVVLIADRESDSKALKYNEYIKASNNYMGCLEGILFACNTSLNLGVEKSDIRVMNKSYLDLLNSPVTSMSPPIRTRIEEVCNKIISNGNKISFSEFVHEGEIDYTEPYYSNQHTNEPLGSFYEVDRVGFKKYIKEKELKENKLKKKIETENRETYILSHNTKMYNSYNPKEGTEIISDNGRVMCNCMKGTKWDDYNTEIINNLQVLNLKLNGDILHCDKCGKDYPAVFESLNCSNCGTLNTYLQGTRLDYCKSCHKSFIS